MASFSEAMRTSYCIAKRDFLSFFSTPMGWISAFILFSISGFAFYVVLSQTLASGGSTNIAGEVFSVIFNFLAWLGIFVAPIFPMRTMTEELNQQTIRIYTSAPIPSWVIVLGKFLGISSFFLVIVALFSVYVLYMAIFSESLEWLVIVAALVGLWLHFSLLSAFSLLVATTTKNIVISYLFSAIGLFILMLLASLPSSPEWIKVNLNFLQLTRDFTEGKVKISTLATYICCISGFLFLSNLILENKRWRF